MKLTHLYVYIYPKIHEDNLTKILSYLTILAFINTLSLMDKEPLHIHFHSIHLVVRKKKKSNSNWLQQKRNLLALIREKCRNNLTCVPIWWRLQIASGFHVRIPLLFLVLPSGWLLYVKKNYLQQGQTWILIPHYLQEGVFISSSWESLSKHRLINSLIQVRCLSIPEPFTLSVCRGWRGGGERRQHGIV